MTEVTDELKTMEDAFKSWLKTDKNIIESAKEVIIDDTLDMKPYLKLIDDDKVIEVFLIVVRTTFPNKIWNLGNKLADRGKMEFDGSFWTVKEIEFKEYKAELKINGYIYYFDLEITELNSNYDDGGNMFTFEFIGRNIEFKSDTK